MYSQFFEAAHIQYLLLSCLELKSISLPTLFIQECLSVVIFPYLRAGFELVLYCAAVIPFQIFFFPFFIQSSSFVTECIMLFLAIQAFN